MIRRRVSAALDHSLPVLGGLASFIHCLFDDDRLARWLRTNPDYEPDAIG